MNSPWQLDCGPDLVPDGHRGSPNMDAVEGFTLHVAAHLSEASRLNGDFSGEQIGVAGLEVVAAHYSCASDVGLDWLDLTRGKVMW